MKTDKQYRYIRGDLDSQPEEHKLAGYFSVFGPAYQMGPGITERIDPNAFTESLQQDSGDIRCLWNHNDDIVLARTGNGTLRLRVDDHGLYGEVEINPNDSDAMNALARIQRGDVSQCSFGFQVLDEEVIDRENGELEFVLKRVRLLEVSPVVFPAYRETSISARQEDASHARAAEFRAWQKKTKEKLNGTKKTNGQEAAG